MWTLCMQALVCVTMVIWICP